MARLIRIVSAAALLAVAAASCFVGAHPRPHPTSSTDAKLSTTGLIARWGEACRQAGPLCRPEQATTPAGCRGAQQTRPAIGFADAIGPGPVYPEPYPVIGVSRLSRQTKSVAFNPRPVTEDANGTPLPGGPWYGDKVLWFVSEDYHGPVLIRTIAVGHRGRARIEMDRFSDAIYVPPAVPPTGSALARHAFDHPSEMWVSGPGCYAWQVDGNDFGYVIYFNAIIAESARRTTP